MDNQQSKALAAYKEQYKLVRKGERKYRLMGIMMFTIACALLVVRSVVAIMSSYIESDLVLDTVFSLMLQIGVLLGVPAIFYFCIFKMKPKEALAFSNFKKTQWFNYLIAVGLGLLAMFVTQGISAIWQMIISALGYTHATPADDLPEKFSFGLMLLSFFTSAVLPGVCEEVAVRGGYLTTIRKSFDFKKTLLIMGITFGLFHQYITQVFYTAWFGVLAALLVIKSKSIFPAMVVHFLNNGTSVYLEYAEKYGWWGGNYFNNLNVGLADSPARVFGAYLLICASFAGLIVLFLYLNSAARLAKKKKVILDSGYDVTNKKVILIGEENKELVRELEMDKEVYGQKIDEELFRPTLRDNAFYIGAAVVAALTTVFSFIWGYIV